MELYIQMGHNMQSLALDLLEQEGPKTLILSPINMSEAGMVTYSKKVKKARGRLMIDPQLYYPRNNHKNLVKYDYYPNDGITLFENGTCSRVIKSLIKLNEQVQTDALLLPSSTEKKIDDRWNYMQCQIIDCARSLTQKPLFSTIALSSDAITDIEQVQKVIGYAESWNVEGIYIVCEHPEKYYLVEKPLWVSNILELVAAMKRQSKKVVVGYASHQLLCLGLAKCDAIASGNFLNLRWFKPDRFEMSEESDISRRAVWYYCPQALSEFKLAILDIAKRMELLERMKPSPEAITPYCEMLFGTALPSSTAYSEKEAFRHYLLAFSKQCKMTVRSSYEETLSSHYMVLGTAESLLEGLRSKGIKGQDRDFSEIIDVNRAAISAFDINYGPVLKNEWDSIE